jgi:tetratricopeptide (TPR) repeat protein
MRALSGAPLRVAMIVVAASSLVGCSRYNNLKALKYFKNANKAYQAQDYREASKLYRESLEADPEAAPPAHFFLANSLEQLYRPSRKGQAENDGLLTEAVKHYQAAADKLAVSPLEDNKKLGKLSLEYLVAAYGQDKLADPAKAEPVVQKMIQMEPAEPSNYFALAKIYEDAAFYDEAEKMLLYAQKAAPSDAAVYLQLAGYYNRQGEFSKTIEALNTRAEKEPTNPEAFQTIAGFYWDETTKNGRLTPAEKKDYVSRGLAAVEKALTLRADYVEAIAFKGLLLRLEANQEKDGAKQAALIKEADVLRDKANEMRKAKQAGAGD